MFILEAEQVNKIIGLNFEKNLYSLKYQLKKIKLVKVGKFEVWFSLK